MKKNYISPEIKTVKISTERSMMLTLSNGEANGVESKSDMDDDWDE